MYSAFKLVIQLTQLIVQLLILWVILIGLPDHAKDTVKNHVPTLKQPFKF